MDRRLRGSQSITIRISNSEELYSVYLNRFHKPCHPWKYQHILCLMNLFLVFHHAISIYIHRIKIEKPNWFTVDKYWRKMCHDSNLYDIREVKCMLAWHVISYWLHRIKILQWKRKFTLILNFMVLFMSNMMITNKIMKKEFAICFICIVRPV